VKFKYLGNGGLSELKYNFVNGRFQKDTNWDNRNWLVREVSQVKLEYNEQMYEKDENTPPF
jgi:hypothetical protein